MLHTYAPVYGQPVVLKGDIEYWTDTGMPVRKVDSKTYRIDTTKETLTRLVEKFSFSSKKEIEVYATNRHANWILRKSREDTNLQRSFASSSRSTLLREKYDNSLLRTNRQQRRTDS